MNHTRDTHKNHIPLTSGEIADLWSTFQFETSGICGLKYFLMHTEDEQIRQLLEDFLALGQERKQKITEFFNQEAFPVPQGFTDKDINLHAPRLFSDKIHLEYVLKTTKIEIILYGVGLMNAVRSDLIEYFTDMINRSQTMHVNAKKMSLEKGLFIHPPKIPTPKQVQFVEKESFIKGWFTERRPLAAQEISHLVYNAKRNALGQAVITGFSQVAQLKEVRRYFERGREISGKHLQVFGDKLYEDYLSESALLLTPEVSDSTVAPFSDKLMMLMITELIGAGIGEYGRAMSMSPRHDLGLQYTRLMAEIAKYSNDGTKILISHGWMEQPPLAADRKDLAK